MRKFIHILLVISFALLVIGNPVWAMYYKSSHAYQRSGLQGVTKKNPPFQKPEEIFLKFPKNGDRSLPTPPVSQSGPGLSDLPVLLLVNKDNYLSSNFVPKNLRVPRIPFSFTKNLPYKKMTAEAALALEKLFRRAKQEHIELVGVSGYRSYRYQKAVYRWNVKTMGKKHTDRSSAEPGHSEHQTGLAMDLSSPYMRFRLYDKFGDTKAGKWLADHAAEFGFIIRYPKGKEKITGYRYEPWHIRYVGEEHARKMTEAGLTLEEYLDNMK